MASCFANLSQKLKHQVILSCSYFPKTYSIVSDYALYLEFDSTRNGFLETVKDENIKEKFKNKIIDSILVQEIIDILKTDERLFYDLSIDVVDSIVFQRMGLTVFEIKKNKNLDLCGRSLIIELSDVIKKSLEMNDTIKGGFKLDTSVSFLLGSLVIGISILARRFL